MDALQFILGGVFPYIAIAVFLVAMVYRIYAWRKLPSPPMTLPRWIAAIARSDRPTAIRTRPPTWPNAD